MISTLTEANSFRAVAFNDIDKVDAKKVFSDTKPLLTLLVVCAVPVVLTEAIGGNVFGLGFDVTCFTGVVVGDVVVLPGGTGVVAGGVGAFVGGGVGAFVGGGVGAFVGGVGAFVGRGCQKTIEL